MTLAKAKLIRVDANDQPIGNYTVDVQFNPESLKVSFNNQVQTPARGAASGNNAGRRIVGSGVTKLAVQLWFDAGSPAGGGQGVDDVRRLTQKVVFFINPISEEGHLVAPGVRFEWGSFKFNGMMESLEENLEYFSADGRPLRASMSFSLSQQKIVVPELQGQGTRELAVARAGDSVQRLAGERGRPEDWRGAAHANGVEDPLRLPVGQLLDLTTMARRIF